MESSMVDESCTHSALLRWKHPSPCTSNDNIGTFHPNHPKINKKRWIWEWGNKRRRNVTNPPKRNSPYSPGTRVRFAKVVKIKGEDDLPNGRNCSWSTSVGSAAFTTPPITTTATNKETAFIIAIQLTVWSTLRRRFPVFYFVRCRVSENAK